MQLAVVIVTWNVRELARQALQTLYADLDEFDAQVYVVDSASSDGTVEALRAEFPQADIYASPENLGFAAGNNHAIRRIMALENPPQAVYLLNPDTITHPGATRTLYNALMAEPDLGLVGARLSYEDGSFQHAAFAFPGLRQLWVEFFPTPGRWIEGRFNGRYPRAWYDSGQPFDVDFTLGATMMLKYKVIQQTGMFDENFFMYCEEIDWAWRIHQAGWRVKCVPAAHITHLSGQSTGQVKPQSVVNLWKSRLYLFEKHYPAWKLTLAKRLVVLGMKRKIRQADSSELIHAYQTVIEMAT
ncbi:MAG: glycosyltransferase family 2 protein [Phototrophicales bacterium]|nr:MAG: glycosyltransferase family 2 protein [Phototrophicales bacterium]RMG76078.1 MAG: glycosyltransferase family 2 protein [Chloroflexota bacterium]